MQILTSSRGSIKCNARINCIRIFSFTLLVLLLKQHEEWLHFGRPARDPLNRQISTSTALPQRGSWLVLGRGRCEALPSPHSQSPSLRTASTLHGTLQTCVCSAGRRKTRTRCPFWPRRKRIGWTRSVIVQSARAPRPPGGAGEVMTTAIQELKLPGAPGGACQK